MEGNNYADQVIYRTRMSYGKVKYEAKEKKTGRRCLWLSHLFRH
jgi:hypothetical protein